MSDILPCPFCLTEFPTFGPMFDRDERREYVVKLSCCASMEESTSSHGQTLEETEAYLRRMLTERWNARLDPTPAPNVGATRPA